MAGEVDSGRWVVEVLNLAGVSQGWLDVQDLRVTARMNGISECSGTVLASSPGAAALDVYRAVIRAWRRNGSDLTGVREARFAGQVHGLREVGDADGLETVEFVARDPLAAALQRFQPWNSSWGPTTLDVAVAGFIGDLAISAEDPAGLDATYPHGLGVVALGGGWPSGTWGFERRRKGEDLFKLLQEGDAATQGFYYRSRPRTSTGTTYADLLIALAPATLSSLAAGVTRTPLEYGAGTRGQIASYAVDRVPPVNSILAVGAEGLTWLIDSESSGAAYGLWPEQFSWTEETTTARLDVLARGVWRPFPTDSIQVELGWPADPRAREALPKMWDDFDLGDSLVVYIRGARRTVSATALVREVTVEVDAEGTERTTGLVLDYDVTS